MFHSVTPTDDSILQQRRYPTRVGRHRADSVCIPHQAQLQRWRATGEQRVNMLEVEGSIYTGVLTIIEWVSKKGRG